jgi:CRP-like cAMP-binding protein
MEIDCSTAYLDEKVKKFAQILYGILFFNIFSIEELYEILREDRLIKWKRFEKNKMIFAENTFDQHFYIIIQGTVDIKKSRGNQSDQTVGKIEAGAVFGEMVICDPDKPRRASAFAAKDSEVILCEFDGTLLNTIAGPFRVKFIKKFFDLVLDRLSDQKRAYEFYQEVIQASREHGADDDQFFQYTLRTSVNEKNRLTQFIKYTDFLIAEKLPPEKGLLLLQGLIKKAAPLLFNSFQSV